MKPGDFPQKSESLVSLYIKGYTMIHGYYMDWLLHISREKENWNYKKCLFALFFFVLTDQYVDEHELSILATRIFRNHGGKELSDVPYFCSQLGIPSTVFNPVCMDRKKSRTDEILYYVFRDWRMASSLTRNKLRKALFDFDQGNKTSLCKLYVKIVNDRFREDSSENS